MKKKSLHTAGFASTSDDQVQRLMANFRRVVTTAKRHLAEDSSESLSGAELWALSQVRAQLGLTVQELANALSAHQTTTSNLVDKLELAKCLRRERGKADKRVVHLFVTPLGNRVLRQATARGAIPEALRRLSGRELDALETGLASLYRELNLK